MISIKVLIGGALFLFPKTSKAQDPLPLTSETIVWLTNEERLKLELPPLAVNQKLTAAAVRKARDIIANDYFAHTTPSGKAFYKWIQEETYVYKSAGENLAIAFDDPSNVMNAWMMSKTHKENILDPYYQEIGIAIVIGEYEGDTTAVIVQLFGEPLVVPLKSKFSSPIAGERAVIKPHAQSTSRIVSWLTKVNTGATVAILPLSILGLLLFGVRRLGFGISLE